MTDPKNPQLGDDACGFIKPWIGRCRNPRPCSEHGDLRCSACGAPATRECDNQIIALMCGEPLCAACACTHRRPLPSPAPEQSAGPREDGFARYATEAGRREHGTDAAPSRGAEAAPAPGTPDHADRIYRAVRSGQWGRQEIAAYLAERDACASPAPAAERERGRLDGSFYKACPLCGKSTSPSPSPASSGPGEEQGEVYRSLWWMHAWLRYTARMRERYPDASWPPTGWARWDKARHRHLRALRHEGKGNRS